MSSLSFSFNNESSLPSFTLSDVYVNGNSVSISSYTASSNTGTLSVYAYLTSSVVSGNTNTQGSLEYLSWSGLSLSETYSVVQGCCTGACTSKCAKYSGTEYVNNFTWILALSASVSGATSVDLGTAYTYTVSTANGSTISGYQWYINGSAVSGATSTSYTYTPITTSNYTIYCTVTDQYMTATSNTLTVTFSDTLNATITPNGNQSYPVSSTSTQAITGNLTGGSGSPFVANIYMINNGSTPCSPPPADGSAVPSTWGSPVATADATSVSYSYSQNQTADYYCLYCEGTDASGWTAFSQTYLSINLTDNLIANANVSNPNVNIGQFTNFTVNVTNGSGNYTYTWYVNGSVYSTGNSSAIQFYPQSTGTYSVYCSVHDVTGGSTVSSNTVTATVNDPLAVNLTPQSGSIVVEGGVLSTVTLTFTNPSTTVIPSGSQIFGNINWSLYYNFLSNDCGNVRFFDMNGNPVYAWMESYNSGSVSNIKSSTSSVVWFLTTQSVPSNYGAYSLFMQIYPSGGSINNEFDGNYWGLAGNQSATYGQYDNGANVFPQLYTNFSGTSLPSSPAFTNYNNGGTVTVNNGITIDLTSTGNYNAYVFDTAIDAPIFIETCALVDTAAAGAVQGVGIYLANSDTSGGYAFGAGWGFGSGTISAGYANIENPGSYSGNSILGLAWIANGNEVINDNYTYYSTNNSSETFASPYYASFGAGYNSSASKSTYYWVRIRNYVAQNPDLSFSGGYQIVLISEVAGGSGSFSYSWYSGNESISSMCGNSPTCVYSSDSGGLQFVYFTVLDKTTTQLVTSPISAINVVGGLSLGISPSIVSVEAGQTFEISLTGISSVSSSSLRYSWYSNTQNSNVGGTELNVYSPVISDVLINTGSTYYYCVVTDLLSGVSGVSPVATVNVYTPQTSSLTSSVSTLLTGNSAVLTLTVSGGSSLFLYTWTMIDPNGTESEISSNPTTSYTFNPAVGSTTGTYTFFVSVTDSQTDAVNYSNNVYIDVYSFSASITASSNPITAGTKINLYSSVLGGTFPLSYDWTVSGNPNSIGSNASVSVAPTSTTTYNLTVTDSSNYTATASITISVNAFIATALTSAISLVNTVTSQIATLSLELNPSTASPTSYQWYMNNSAISGATSSTYLFQPKTNGIAAGSYSFYCLLNGSIVSSSVTVKVVSVYSVVDTIPVLDNNFQSTVNTSPPQVIASTKFNVFVNGNPVSAFSIQSEKTINSAGSCSFNVPKSNLSLISIGNTATLYYRNQIVFTGKIYSITKYSTGIYTVQVYDGLWDFAGVTDHVATGTLTELISNYAAQTSLGTTHIQTDGANLTQTMTIDFQGQSVMQIIIQLLASFGYYLVCDEFNSLRILNYTGTPQIYITENTDFVVYSKAFDVLQQYGSVELIANVPDLSSETFIAYSGSGTPVRQVGVTSSGYVWLALPQNTPIMDQMSSVLGQTYLQGNWNNQLITYKYYSQASFTPLGELQSFNVTFADGTVLNNLIPTDVQIQSNGIQLTLSTYSGIVLQLLNTITTT